jgi:hypothetical protein
MHRHDHRGRAAHRAELTDHGSRVAQPAATPAELGGHGQREQPRLGQRVDLLPGEFAELIDVGRARRHNLVDDARQGVLK